MSKIPEVYDSFSWMLPTSGKLHVVAKHQETLTAIACHDFVISKEKGTNEVSVLVMSIN
jgi:F0F1-type ATP synthase epsilon subunit